MKKYAPDYFLPCCTVLIIFLTWSGEGKPSLLEAIIAFLERH